MHSNLDLLKREILESLRNDDFTVFFGLTRPGDDPNIYWDSDHYPEHRDYLAAMKKLGVKLVLVSEREFETADVQRVLEDMEDCDFTAEERRSLERRLREFRIYDGRLCAMRLTAHYEGRPYVLDLRTDWFQDYLDICDEVATRLPGDEDEEDDSSLGGFYSNN